MTTESSSKISHGAPARLWNAVKWRLWILQSLLPFVKASSLMRLLFARLKEGNTRLVLKNNHILSLSPVDFGTLSQVFAQGEYKKLLEMIKNREDLIVLDLGANIGLFATWLSLNMKPKNIVCVEPMPQNLELLRQNCANLNVDIHPFAMSNKPGMFRVDFAGPGSSLLGHEALGTMKPEILDQATTHNVEVRDIFTHFDGQKFDVVKMDIEGAEGDIMGDERFKAFIAGTNWLILEWHANANIPSTEHEAWFARRLSECGFVVSPIFSGEYMGILLCNRV